ncbi:hypothetical protein WME75_01285 [Sorangium sp. So ce1014]
MSRGKATVQGATIYVAYGDGNWHNSKYEITDTLPGMITVNNADSIDFIGNVVKHSGNEGIAFVNDVVNSLIVGNYITDIAGSGILPALPRRIVVAEPDSHVGRRRARAHAQDMGPLLDGFRVVRVPDDTVLMHPLI